MSSGLESADVKEACTQLGINGVPSLVGGRWAHDRVWRVCGDGEEFAIKRWLGDAQVSRLLSEVSVTKALILGGVCHLAAPLRTASTGLAGDVSWSLYPWIKGRPFLPHSECGGHYEAQLCELLARIHAVSSCSMPANPRLESILEDRLGNGHGELLYGFPDGIVSCVRRLAERRGKEIASLTKTLIHGDVNFDNVIIAGDELFLLDFEFARKDVALIDLALLWAPARDDSGGFIPLDREVYERCIDRYRAVSPIPKEEVELLPLVTLLFQFLILRDLLQSESPYVRSVRELVSAYWSAEQSRLIALL
jgi:Ser/Thr protein kinase RdoA (MazF antagonist)